MDNFKKAFAISLVAGLLTARWAGLLDERFFGAAPGFFGFGGGDTFFTSVTGFIFYSYPFLLALTGTLFFRLNRERVKFFLLAMSPIILLSLLNVGLLFLLVVHAAAAGIVGWLFGELALFVSRKK